MAKISQSDLTALVAFLSNDEEVKLLCKSQLPSEYSYASLSTMLLDAIFSIGVRYGQVKAVVARHTASQKYDPWRRGAEDPYPLRELIREGRSGTDEQFAAKLGNRGRTSTRSGILKATAVVLAAEVFVQHGIVDVASWGTADEAVLSMVERDFRAITGQKSGVSWDYLSMLAGDEGRVKPDRMVVRYVEVALKRSGLMPREAGELLIAAATALRGRHGYPPSLAARHLDWAVWSVARRRLPLSPQCL